MAYFMGIDVSTTGVKALLVDDQGKVIDTATTALPLSTPQPLWSEQAPADWWNGAVNSIKQVLKGTGVFGEEVGGIGLTGQMHGLTLLDKNGEVVGINVGAGRFKGERFGHANHVENIRRHLSTCKDISRSK